MCKVVTAQSKACEDSAERGHSRKGPAVRAGGKQELTQARPQKPWGNVPDVTMRSHYLEVDGGR